MGRKSTKTNKNIYQQLREGLSKRKNTVFCPVRDLLAKGEKVLKTSHRF